ncbi:hypothetical protein ACIP2Z_27950 [Streptomyces iakyrus]|uniref:Transposase n=1 Tax=Streptomyces iakyrus TaxID=68219 RepID=A0ABW8FL35_9ACTN
MRAGSKVPGGPVVELECQVWFGGRAWTVAALADGQVQLVAEDGAVAAVLLSLLFADAGFAVLDAPGGPRVPPLGSLESLPEAARERALGWERHVREVETGQPGPGAAGPPRAEYDPQARTLAQREEAKAAELSAAGMPTSVVTVRRMRARYRREGVWGLVDHRATRPRSLLGRADERVVAALREVLEAGRERSSGTLGRLRVYTERLLAERYRGRGGSAALECDVQPARARPRRRARAAGQRAAAPVALSPAGSPVRTDDGDDAGRAGDDGQHRAGHLRGAR